MSELSNVIEARLHAAEVAATAAGTNAASAQATADGASAKADAVDLKFAIGATAPDAPFFGQLWSDTSSPGNVTVKCYSGADWIQINPV